MEVTRLSSEGQVIIPKALCAAHLFSKFEFHSKAMDVH